MHLASTAVSSEGSGSVVVDSLFIVALGVRGIFYVWFLFSYAVLNVLSSFAVISLGKRELVALL